MAIQMQPVTGSSSIAAVGYDPETETLEVQFVGSGTKYTHEGVPSSEYEALINARSVGSYYANNIKGQY